MRHRAQLHRYVHGVANGGARLVGVVTALAALTTLTAACGADEDTGATLRVPADQPTIQDAIDAAEPGDVVLVAAGVYHEAVRIETERIVLRGEDRNDVILDGRDELANGVTVVADGVAVENLTATRYQQNGVLFNGVGDEEGGVDPEVAYGSGEHALVGYRASYVTAYNNGTYGIYAFAARDGRIDHSYTSGHPDSGIYVGQCSPCDVTVSESVAERNAIGILFTNTSSGARIERSTVSRNRLGIAVNSEYAEQLAPSVGVEVADNTVTDNDDPDTPAIGEGFFSGGIAIGGSAEVVVQGNRVSGHDDGVGIMVVPLAGFVPAANEVAGNVLDGNGTDLALVSEDGDAARNCFTGNTFATAVPESIESVLPCPPRADVRIEPTRVNLPAAPPGVDYRELPAPPPQPTMPAPPEPES